MKTYQVLFTKTLYATHLEVVDARSEDEAWGIADAMAKTLTDDDFVDPDGDEIEVTAVEELTWNP